MPEIAGSGIRVLRSEDLMADLRVLAGGRKEDVSSHAFHASFPGMIAKDATNALAYTGLSVEADRSVSLTPPAPCPLERRQ